ncbi:MAG: hypothetical protein AAF495_02300 [Pseudomonadota bacterium]
MVRLPTPGHLVRYGQRCTAALYDRVVRVPRCSAPKDVLAILHLSRSGSTVLGSLLAQHPKLYWDGEVFDRRRPRQQLFRRLQGVGDRQDPERIAWLMRYAGERIYVLSAAGFYGRRPEELIAELKGLGCNRFVLLRRDNLLRQRLSFLIADKTARWHLSSTRPPSLTPVTLEEPSKLLAHMGNAQALYRQLTDSIAGRPLLELTYEVDIEVSPSLAYDKVCRFLEIEPLPVKVRYGRMNDYPISELVINYQEVAEAFRGSEFEWMLEE